MPGELPSPVQQAAAATYILAVKEKGEQSKGNEDEDKARLALEKQQRQTHEGYLAAHGTSQVLRPDGERVFAGIVTLGAETQGGNGFYLYHPVSDSRRVIVVVTYHRRDVINNNVAYLYVLRLYGINHEQAAGLQRGFHTGAVNRHKGQRAS